jgi:BolA protein
MNRYDRLMQLLLAAFPGAAISLFDDSESHASHQHGFSGETHYRVQMKHSAFAGLTALQKHRLILAAIRPETDAGMHSFVIDSATEA